MIENLSFSVAAGEVYGLLGANGVGKSTTIECILGTKKADSGTVRILGLDPVDGAKATFFKQVGGTVPGSKLSRQDQGKRIV